MPPYTRLARAREPFPLPSLPPELILLIASYLPTPALSRLSRLSQQLHTLLSSTLTGQRLPQLPAEPLLRASSGAGNLPCTLLLLRHVPVHTSVSVLSWAAERGYAGFNDGLVAVRTLLDAGVRDAPYQGRTALHRAVLAAQEEVVAELLSRKVCDVNARTDGPVAWWPRGSATDDIPPIGDTALHLACATGSGDRATGMVRLLVRAGADVMLENWEGKAALHVAACEGHVGAMAVLLDEAGVKVDARCGPKRTTPFVWATRAGGSSAALRWLKDRGACVDAVDTDGRCALLWAVLEVVYLRSELVALGARIDVAMIGAKMLSDQKMKRRAVRYLKIEKEKMDKRKKEEERERAEMEKHRVPDEAEVCPNMEGTMFVRP